MNKKTGSKIISSKMTEADVSAVSEISASTNRSLSFTLRALTRLGLTVHKQDLAKNPQKALKRLELFGVNAHSKM